jgi:ribosome-interacting GTPase 1
MEIDRMLGDLESDIKQVENDLKIAKYRLARIRQELKEEKEDQHEKP